MRQRGKQLILLLMMLLVTGVGVLAQDNTETTDLADVLPRAYRLQNLRFEYQGWNNCGPATLTNALTFFGYNNNQTRAATWLKPNYEDKNVSPWQMVEFVNTQVPELSIYALNRSGGTLELMKKLLAHDFPVIIEEGYDPEPARLGWMGHYLLLTGYDDGAGVFITNDSYLGPNMQYTYDHVQTFWQHFNYTYIVLYRLDRHQELMDLLGDDADEYQNIVNAREIARAEAVADQSDKFAWFNMGSLPSPGTS
jgi:hypothetical protein